MNTTTYAEAKTIDDELDLTDRIETLAEKPAFITIKDHKDNIPSRIQHRLINPSKSEIGIISKQILDRINVDPIKHTSAIQWKNTGALINWFNSIPDKQDCSFLTYDVVKFYPSITQKLLQEALHVYVCFQIHEHHHACKENIIIPRQSIMAENKTPA